MKRSAIAIGSFVVGAWLAAGCGAATSEDLLVERFEAPEAHLARRRAPDLFAAAKRARGEAAAAKAAGDEDAFDDHATRARLLLAAAIAEADRAVFEERRLALDAQTQRAIVAARRDEAERAEIEHAERRTLAAKVASEQARQAFVLATEAETRRYAKNASERERMHQEAAAHLLRRTRLLLAAAEAMQADAANVAQVNAKIRDAERARDGTGALGAADEAWREATILLGNLRARYSQPTQEEITALREAATDAGFEIEAVDRGLALSVLSLFRGETFRIGGDARRNVERLAAILQSHPHGPVHIEARAPASPSASRLAERRAQALRDALVASGIDANRLVVTPFAPVTEGANARLDVVLTAYGVR